ncbi:MAG TPA: peptidase M28, partial [Candidatus Angelobacter sp.]|nr:peptidase M28 [Candidatus Angelobacter sp.]
MKRFGAVLLIVSSCLLAAHSQSTSPATQKAMNAIDAEKIRATVKYLSDDKLEGRGTGQKGGDMAADWIAAQFKSYGLAPAGDDGTYFQQINFFGVTTEAKQTRFTFVPKSGAEMALKFADDYVATDQTHSQKSEIDAPIVFVGYGINAPEYKWDDYKGTDLKGKVLLMLVNEPPSEDPNFFKGRALTYYG